MVDQIRHIGFQIAMLLGMQVNHKLAERPVQAGNLALHHDKA